MFRRPDGVPCTKLFIGHTGAGMLNIHSHNDNRCFMVTSMVMGLLLE